MKVNWYSSKARDIFTSVKNISTATMEEMNPVYIRFYDLSSRVKDIIKEALHKILHLLDRLYLKDTVYTLLKETLVNGVKANMKRSMFFYHGLDISNPDDYKKGIKFFKETMLSNYDEYVTRLKEENRYVLLKISYKDNHLKIDIVNNSPISKEELDRINERIEKSKELNSIPELFLAGMSSKEEGEGLGLGMSILLLKNEGFGADKFSIRSNEKQTIASFDLPIEVKKEQKGYKIASEMISEVDSLPTFDTNVTRIQNLIKSPDSSISVISDEVQNDISLTTNILKLANSAAFGLSKKVENVDQAIQLIGLRELSNLLFSIGTKKIMEKRYSAFEEVWETSKESAFICFKLAKIRKLDREKSNNLRIAGLLHDIGKVIFLSIAEDTVRAVSKIGGLRKEPEDMILEEAIIGVSHTTIGAMISQKWNFPESVQKAIEFHHNPYLITNKDYATIVYAVYLSDRIVEFNQGFDNFEKIYCPSLRHFGFDKKSFIKFSVDTKREYIKSSYQR